LRRLLLVTRNFAPTSHVSVERAIKLAKYLPRFGWTPTILTGAPPSPGLPEDPSLLDQVSGIEVLRARAPELTVLYSSSRAVKGGGKGEARHSAPRRGPLHPKSWIVPDLQVLWYPFAVRAALRRARGGGWDAVVGTCFPPTALLIAYRIGVRLRLPYVPDFRDSWTAYHGAPERPAPLAALERRLEARILRRAAAVVTVNRAFVTHTMESLAEAERPPLHVIGNGYDEDDFRDTVPADLPPFSIVHTGLLRRAPVALWAALAHAVSIRPELRGRLHFWQVGFVDPRAGAALDSPPEGVAVHQVPPAPQREAIGYMLGADLLMVEEFGMVMPSKTLQYLRAGRPILCLLERNGQIRDVLAGMPQAYLASPRETPKVGELIARLASAPRTAPLEPSPPVTAHSREEIARRYAEVLEGVTAATPRLSP
jgi:hypothetical protein